jgi:hypothetical protein
MMGAAGNVSCYVYEDAFALDRPGANSPSFEESPWASTSMAWVEVPQGATWHIRTSFGDEDELSSAGLSEEVSTILASAINETFETGYQSVFHKNLTSLYVRFGSPVVEALCHDLKALSRPYSSLLREAFRFLASLDDPESQDFRLVFLAGYLSDSSPINRDSAALALADLADPRGAQYLRAASENETHPRLKFEMLEMAAELDM